MISHIAIKNFRSLADVSVDLDPVTVFIGKSGTGKSNFVAALRFLRDYLSNPEVFAYEDSRNIWPIGDSKSDLSFHVKFTIESQDFEYSLTLSKKRGKLQEQLITNGDLVFVANPNQRNDQQLTLTSPRTTGDQRVADARLALIGGIGCYEFSSAVMTDPIASRAKGLQSLVQYADDGSNYLLVVAQLSSALQDRGKLRSISACLQKLNSTVESVEVDSLQNPTTINVIHRYGETRVMIPLHQESDGFRRFYAQLLALYQSPPKQTLVFEEPENGIYPAALALLAAEFRLAAEQNRGQVLITTHNPVFLDNFPPTGIRVVEMQNGRTTIGRLAKEQADSVREGLLYPGELLTVTSPYTQTPEAIGG